MKKVILNIGGMSCSACSSGLEKYLNKQKGIKASVNLVLAQALIEYEDAISIEEINQYIKDAGFESLGIYNPKEKKKESRKIPFYLFSTLAFIILYISMAPMIHFPSIPFLDPNTYPNHYAITLLILTIPFFFYGKDIFISGYKNLIHKTPNMDTLVSIGVITSFLYSVYGTIMIFSNHPMYAHHLYYESCAIVIYFIKLGRFIDKKSKEKTKEAIEELVQITPTMALRKTKEGEEEITIDEVEFGDILIAKAGMKIAVDGIITHGNSHLDEAFITGESLPIKKSVSDRVIAGSINLDGYIEYEAQKIGKDSTISEIVRLVIEATNTKAPIAHLADVVSSYFVPIIICIAIITLIGSLLFGLSSSDSFNSFVSVLVVACPCALGLATPLAIVVSEGVCAKQGILVKTSKTLENAHKVHTIVFDKTGTLTHGNMKVSKVFCYGPYKEKELLSLVSDMESKSNHPISRAFVEFRNDSFQKVVEQFETIAGIGIKGIIDGKQLYIGNNKLFNQLNLSNNYLQEETQLSQLGHSIIYVIEENKVIGLIGVKDIIRNNSKKAIQSLQKMGKEIIMLTGDHTETANRIAKEIGIDQVIANVMPSEKANVIQELKNHNKKVMMIGDGINDAPSLAYADIGISINSGTDIAANSADVILMNDNLEKISSLIVISKKTLQNIKQNLFWAFFYNICMIPIAMGLLRSFHISMNPMIAGLAMMLSSFTVILNALRLKKRSFLDSKR